MTTINATLVRVGDHVTLRPYATDPERIVAGKVAEVVYLDEADEVGIQLEGDTRSHWFPAGEMIEVR